jgi:hypothetical protein
MQVELIKQPDNVTLSLGINKGANEHNEDELVSQAKGGSHAAFEKLVQRYEVRVFRLAQRIARSHEDAEDVIQQSFQKAFVHLDRFEGRSSFSTWLTRIVLNEALIWHEPLGDFAAYRSTTRAQQTTAPCQSKSLIPGRTRNTVAFNRSGGAFCSRPLMS